MEILLSQYQLKLKDEWLPSIELDSFLNTICKIYLYKSYILVFALCPTRKKGPRHESCETFYKKKKMLCESRA